MKFVKKLFCMSLAAVLALSCAACTGKENTEYSSEDSSGFAQTAVISADGTAESEEQGESGTKSDKYKIPGSAAKSTTPSPSDDAPTQGSQSRETVRVTITEGMTLTQIFKKLEENGVCSFSDLMSTSQSYDYSYYPLIAARPSNTRAFELEGYLFPETYDFYKNEKPQDAIGRFLRVGENKITSSDRAKAKSMGYSIDQILTVASIIEKEGSNPNEVAKIAAVIYNRLEAGMKLQMDSGIYYIERNVKPYISGDVNRYNSLYNMYKCSGLPAGPICNPGKKTINAALNPANVSYLYFCHDSNANYYYADTWEEHQANLEKAGISS